MTDEFTIIAHSPIPIGQVGQERMWSIHLKSAVDVPCGMDILLIPRRGGRALEATVSECIVLYSPPEGEGFVIGNCTLLLPLEETISWEDGTRIKVRQGEGRKEEGRCISPEKIAELEAGME